MDEASLRPLTVAFIDDVEDVACVGAVGEMVDLIDQADPILSGEPRWVLQVGREKDQSGFMPRKRRQLHPLAPKIAELIAAEVKARSGPNATFEEEQDLAAAVAAEVLAELATRDPKAGGG